MKDWNVVASVRGYEFRSAVRLLEQWGPVERTDYYNVVVLRVEDVAKFADELWQRIDAEPGILNTIARVVPSTDTFAFQSREDFENKAREIVLRWLPKFAGKSFHVRMHRRGFRKKLSSQEEEQFLDAALLQELERRGTPGRIEFDNPDLIAAVETVGGRAGLSLWTREDLERYLFLGLN